MVRASAIATARVSFPPPKARHIDRRLTDKRQPVVFEPDDRQHRQSHPQRRLAVQREPEEAPVGRVHEPPAGLVRLRGALEHPVRFSRNLVDLVPPPQSHETAPGDVLEVVEVRGEGEDGEHEDEDQVVREENAEEIDEETRCGRGC